MLYFLPAAQFIISSAPWIISSSWMMIDCTCRSSVGYSHLAEPMHMISQVKICLCTSTDCFSWSEGESVRVTLCCWLYHQNWPWRWRQQVFLKCQFSYFDTLCCKPKDCNLQLLAWEPQISQTVKSVQHLPIRCTVCQCKVPCPEANWSCLYACDEGMWKTITLMIL